MGFISDLLRIEQLNQTRKIAKAVSAPKRDDAIHQRRWRYGYRQGQVDVITALRAGTPLDALERDLTTNRWLKLARSMDGWEAGQYAGRQYAVGQFRAGASLDSAVQQFELGSDKDA